MLAVRVIPVVLYDGAVCVKPVAFGRPARPAGDLRQVIRVYARREVDEVVLLDVSGGRCDPAAVASIAEEMWGPFAVGGGIASEDDMAALLRAGADKGVIGPRGLAQRGLLEGISARWGAQAITAHIPAVGAADAVLGASEAVARGAGEVLLTARDRDGTQRGYDVDMIAAVARAVTVPVVAAGGCASAADAVAAIRAGAHAVAAGAIFHFTATRPADLRHALRQAEVPVRPEGRQKGAPMVGEFA